MSASGSERWDQLTPAEGWTVAVQIAHLAWTDTAATQAAADPDAFNAYLNDLLATATPDQLTSLVDDAAYETAREPRAALLERWRAGRAELIDALHNVPAGQRVPWFGPPMSAASMATARLMETWAHGQDVFDALGQTRESTSRLRHIAHIGVRTRDFAFINNDMTPPVDEFLVVLTGPGGDHWTWGPADATQSVTGPALDFCLLVTQRRHRSDLALQAVGSDAEAWLGIAQAFAGPSGPGRRPSK